MIKNARFNCAVFLAAHLPAAQPVPSCHARYATVPTSRIFVGRGLSHDMNCAESKRLEPLKFRFCGFCVLSTPSMDDTSPPSNPIPTP
jgi:hypothetical protein